MSFRLKTILGIAAIEAVLLFTLIFAGLRWLHDSNEEQLIQRGTTTAQLFAASTKDAVLSTDLASLQSFVAEALTAPGVVYARVRDSADRVLAEDGDPAALARPFVADADPSAVPDGIFDTFAAIREGGMSFGRVEIGLSVESFRGLLRNALSGGIAVAVLELVLVALFSLLLGTYLTRQLARLKEASDRIAQEGPGFRIPEYGKDEVAQAVVAFNKMSSRLAQSQAERQQAEAELQLAAQAFETREAIFITDADARILRVNRAFSAITGYEEAEVIGKTPRLLKSGRQGADFYRDMWQRLLSEGHWEGEIENRRKDGEIFPEWLSITAVRDSEGRVTHYVSHFLDISEQKRNEEALREARARAEQASEAKSRFLATMSHEIRTPLNAIINMNELLLESALDGEQRQYAETASEAGRNLLAIVNSVLDFSKIEAGRLEVRLQPSGPKEIASSVVRLLAPQALAKGIDLDMVVEPGVPRLLETDPGLLRQILLNLVGNAVKFTERGRVRLRLLVDPHGATPSIHFEIIDTGIGIPLDRQTELFSDFTQVDSSRTRRYGGAGLGLAISRSLARSLGGDIEFESTPGQGSRFWLRLPVRTVAEPKEASEPAALHDPRSPEPPAADRAPPILLVDDSEPNRLVATAILSKAGYRVDAAETGVTAVAAVREKHYGLVLMDVAMPDMDGLEATRAIRAMPGERGRVPVVAMTAGAFNEDRERCLRAGMDDYLSKPLARAELLRTVDRWLKGAWTNEAQAGSAATAPRQGER